MTWMTFRKLYKGRAAFLMPRKQSLLSHIAPRPEFPQVPTPLDSETTQWWDSVSQPGDCAFRKGRG